MAVRLQTDIQNVCDYLCRYRLNRNFSDAAQHPMVYNYFAILMIFAL